MKKILSIFLFILFVSILSSDDSFSQNVGIGTVAPAFKLDVKNGSINTDSLYRINSSPVLYISDPGNLFIGRQAGPLNTGGYNVFSGHSAGLVNTSGSFNSFFGSNTGIRNTTGSRNSFFGFDAGFGNIDGWNNSFFGMNSGGSVTSGSGNSFFGFNSGLATTTGYSNIAIGNETFYNNTIGHNNIAIGDSALYNQTANVTNLAIGSKAGFSTTVGSSNSFIGYKSGYFNTSGYGNTFEGTEAGKFNTTGFVNTFLGDSAGLSNISGYANTYTGYKAGYLSTGTVNSFYGALAGSSNTSGIYNCFIGQGSGGYNTTGNYNTMLGALTDLALHNQLYSTAVGFGATVSCSNCMVLGGTTFVGSQTRVGINNSLPVTDLHIIQQTDANLDNSRGIRLQRPSGNQWRVFLDPLNNFIFQYNNNVYAYLEPVNGTLISSSDVRLKKDISSMDLVLDKLLLLQPKTYHYIASSDANRTSWGFLAQDVEKLFPDFVFSSENGMKGIAYSNFSVIAVKAIQEQQQVIVEQKQKLDMQQQQIEEILKELSYLRKKIDQ